MSKHTEFFTKLFQEFNSKGVTYFVIKNYEGLPESSTRDVDLWVKKEYQKRALKILLNTAKELNLKLVKTSIRMGYYKDGLYYFISENNFNDIICIDISPFLHWKGISYLDEDLFENFVLAHKKGFFIPYPGIEAAAFIFRGAMMGEIKEKDKSKIIECIERDSETFLKVLERPFGKKTAIFLLNKIKEKNWGEIEKNINHLHFVILKRAIIHRPLYQIRQWIFYYYERIRAHLFPEGSFFLVLFGPDGSGKTTISKALFESENIRRLFCMRKYIYRRFYISWFKKIALQFKKGKIIDVNAIKDERGNIIPLSILKAIIYLAYLAIEFFIGHYYIRRLKSNSALIVFDRYFYDYIVFKDFERCPRWFSFLLTKIIPKPDAVIYLKGDPETIYNRKREYSLNEIKRQIKICEEIKRFLPNLIELDTNKSIKDNIHEIEKLIINKLYSNK